MKSIILLHGALGSSKQFNELKSLLSDKYKVYSFDFEGHGGIPLSKSFTIESFSDNLVDFIQKNEIYKPVIFGYSMGGYVALYTESQQPGFIGEIITLGTKFHWTPASAKKEIELINPVKIKEKVPQFAKYLQSIHAPGDWEEMMLNTQQLMRLLGDKPLLTAELLAKVQIPVTLLLGEIDSMVSKEETELIWEMIPKGRIEIVNGIPHPIQMIEGEKIKVMIDSVVFRVTY